MEESDKNLAELHSCSSVSWKVELVCKDISKQSAEGVAYLLAACSKIWEERNDLIC